MLNLSAPIEHELFTYGYAARAMMHRAAAEKAARCRIGEYIIMPGEFLRITGIRFEDDVPDGSKGRVVAICELISQKEVII